MDHQVVARTYLDREGGTGDAGRMGQRRDAKVDARFTMSGDTRSKSRRISASDGEVVLLMGVDVLLVS
jgi:hypothetical protein